MEAFEAFNILNIPTNSSVDEIKKSFHKLIFLYHPDSSLSKDSSFAKILIEAYKNALKIVEEKNKKDFTYFQNEFKTFLDIDFFAPKTDKDYFKLTVILLKNIEKIFYSKKDLHFYKNLLVFLNQNFEKIQNPSALNFIRNFLSVILILVNSRLQALEINSKEEYLFEILRKIFISYIKNIVNSKDYLSFRFAVNSNHDSLLNDIIIYIKKTKELVYKEELSSMLFIAFFFIEEDFNEKIFELI